MCGVAVALQWQQRLVVTKAHLQHVFCIQLGPLWLRRLGRTLRGVNCEAVVVCICVSRQHPQECACSISRSSVLTSMQSGMDGAELLMAW